MSSKKLKFFEKSEIVKGKPGGLDKEPKNLHDLKVLRMLSLLRQVTEIQTKVFTICLKIEFKMDRLVKTQ